MNQLLQQGARQFGLELSPAQLDAFDRYSEELLRWNQRFNLTRITSPDEVTIKHFLDSLSVYPALAPSQAELSLIDVGSGAGFPGLPLKIAQPRLRLTLLEAIQKKTRFLEQMRQTLALSGVEILSLRAEVAGQLPEQRGRYEVAVARAVAAGPVLAEYTLPLIKVGGTVILQKGQLTRPEIEATTNALKVLGGRIKQIRPVTVPFLPAERQLIIIEKISPTPKAYPRRAGLPAKKPL
jgi:16S rRNA (guanine527-N7)-methyltransferase